MSGGPPQAWRDRPYSQLLRGPNLHWWRPLLSGLIMVGAFVAVTVGSGLTFTVYLLASGRDGPSDTRLSDADFTRWMTTPTGLAVTNLFFATLIVASQVAVWGGFGWRPRWVASVAGGVRWGWLARCYLVAAVVIVVLDLGLVVLDGGLDVTPERGAAMLAIVVLLTTPLQAAGEEYLFRGWLTQAIGSVVGDARAGGVICAVVSSTAFALAHGEQDLWLFAERFGFGLIASWLVWRTGGLEASIAVHGVNNLVAFALTLLSGQLAQTLTVTEGSAGSTAIDLLVIAAAAVAIERLARRQGVVRLFSPPPRVL